MFYLSQGSGKWRFLPLHVLIIKGAVAWLGNSTHTVVPPSVCCFIAFIAIHVDEVFAMAKSVQVRT